MKRITFVVPCYNSQDYLDGCVESLLPAGEEAEIILIDDGSTDETPAICDRYAAQYPEIVRAVHQPNGGHGAGVNHGLALAQGTYFKVVDSDDRLAGDALQELLTTIREMEDDGQGPDLFLCNYVYVHTDSDERKRIDYSTAFPEREVFTWDDVGHFRVGRYILMHSVVARTEILRGCGLKLPEHTFYVDNIFVYYPLPYIRTMYYLNLDLYLYSIGRADQSVNEKIMISRVDQQIRVTKLMASYYDFDALKAQSEELAKYMFRYLSMMMTICTELLNLDGSPEAMEKRTQLWKEIVEIRPEISRRLRYYSLAALTHIPGEPARHVNIMSYRLADKVFKFN